MSAERLQRPARPSISMEEARFLTERVLAGLPIDNNFLSISSDKQENSTSLHDSASPEFSSEVRSGADMSEVNLDENNVVYLYPQNLGEQSIQQTLVQKAEGNKAQSSSKNKHSLEKKEKARLFAQPLLLRGINPVEIMELTGVSQKEISNIEQMMVRQGDLEPPTQAQKAELNRKEKIFKKKKMLGFNHVEQKNLKIATGIVATQMVEESLVNWSFMNELFKENGRQLPFLGAEKLRYEFFTGAVLHALEGNDSEIAFYNSLVQKYDKDSQQEGLNDIEEFIFKTIQKQRSTGVDKNIPDKLDSSEENFEAHAEKIETQTKSYEEIESKISREKINERNISRALLADITLNNAIEEMSVRKEGLELIASDYEKVQRYAKNAIRKYGGYLESDDVVQEIAMRVAGKQINWAYLYKTALSVVIDSGRKHSSKFEVARYDSTHGYVEYNSDEIKLLTKDESSGLYAPSSDEPEEVILLHDIKSFVQEGIQKLPSSQQEVVLLQMQGFTQSEMAQKLDVPLGTIKTRTRLAFDKLREMLEPAKRSLFETV